MASAVVLLSSGLDSTVNLYAANQELKVSLALTLNYGQKSAEKEIDRSKLICEKLNVSHRVLALPWFKEFTPTSLVQENLSVPSGSDIAIDDFEKSKQTAEQVWVPNRNGIFLNIAAAYAESLSADFVIPGFNLEEASTFPDNSSDFLNAVTRSLSFSTATSVRTKCYTTDMTKKEIVELGKDLNVPFDLMWSCYLSGENMCGQCESCQRFFRAVES
jgi:7-cyano-7-deazaguanine synthase